LDESEHPEGMVLVYECDSFMFMTLQMEETLRLKFDQHCTLREELLKTGNAELFEVCSTIVRKTARAESLDDRILTKMIFGAEVLIGVVAMSSVRRSRD
jgi:hypothetical protein